MRAVLRTSTALALLLGLGVASASLPAAAQQTGQPQAQAAQPGEALSVSIGPSELRRLQEALREAGHDPGPIDGQWGPQTASALREFQQGQGLDATGSIDVATIAALGRSAPALGAGGEEADAGQTPGQQPEQGGQAQPQEQAPAQAQQPPEQDGGQPQGGAQVTVITPDQGEQPSAQQQAAGAQESGQRQGGAQVTVITPEQGQQQAAGDEQPAAAAAGEQGQVATAARPAETAEQQPAAADEGPLYGMAGEEIVGREVVNDQGEAIGEVEDIVLDPQDQTVYAIVSVGGFLGIGDMDVPVALDQLQVADDQLVLPGASDDELEEMPRYEAGMYQPLQRDAPVAERVVAEGGEPQQQQ